MREEHLDVVMRHEEEMFGTEAWSRNAYRDELRDTVMRKYFAVLADNELFGWGGVRVLGGEAEILTVGVVPAGRRQGIGTSLVRALSDEAIQRGAVDAFLEVRIDNEAARRLYEENGFVEMGIRPGYYDAGRVDALTMHKTLRPGVVASNTEREEGL